MKICSQCSELFADDASFCPFDGSSLVRSTDPHLGRTLAARYRLVKRLGTGGMAVVYLARHVLIERQSAIKILRQDLSLNPVHRERFLREARAVNRIDHPNIVAITDFGEADGLVYLVMEYVAGDSLAAHVAKGRFAWPRAARIALQITSALGRAHQTGIIHRDLKPDNILLVPSDDPDHSERVKLTDFGIAKLVDAPALTYSEQLFGTPGYIPPEYLAGTACDERADLYSLGVVLYEMLSGELPYEGTTHAQLLVLPLTQAPIPLSVRVDGVPRALDTLIARLLSRDAHDRPRDAFEVYDALTEILRSAPSGDRPITGGVSLSPPLEPLSESFVGSIAADIVSGAGADAVSRWDNVIARLEVSIATARTRGGAKGLEEASELVELARERLIHLRRIASTVAQHQAQVDRLEAHAHSFRASLGNAIDQLSLDRSRERARLLDIQARRAEERAALAAEEERARATLDDLTFQIATLQRRLDDENEHLDREMSRAVGALEGALAAVRHLNGEIARALRDAGALL